jgi:transcriptional regulator with XRE-family HTH domain
MSVSLTISDLTPQQARVLAGVLERQGLPGGSLAEAIEAGLAAVEGPTVRAEIARLLGISPQAWSRYIAGTQTEPKAATRTAWLRRLDAAGYRLHLTLGPDGWRAA